LSDLGRFATLWPINPKLPATVIHNYSNTNIPTGLDAPWFLSDDANDDESTNSSDTTPEAEADPDDSDYFAPTDHLYDDPPPDPHAPPNLDPDAQTRETWLVISKTREVSLAKTREALLEIGMKKTREPELAPIVSAAPPPLFKVDPDAP
jgi:hypothetical protein